MYSAGNCYNTNVLTIKSAEEITFACSIALIGISVSMLQRFIQEYAYSLLDRMNHVNNLTKINTELKNQLKA